MHCVVMPLIGTVSWFTHSRAAYQRDAGRLFQRCGGAVMKTRGTKGRKGSWLCMIPRQGLNRVPAFKSCTDYPACSQHSIDWAEIGGDAPMPDYTQDQTSWSLT